MLVLSDDAWRTSKDGGEAYVRIRFSLISELPSNLSLSLLCWLAVSCKKQRRA